MKRLLILGAGGHGRVIGDCALAMKFFDQIAYLDDGGLTTCCGLPVLGVFGDLSRLRHAFAFVHVALGDNEHRMEWLGRARGLGYQLPALIHPRAFLSSFALVGAGCALLPGSMVNACAVLGDGCIVNTGAVVEHDCVLGGGVHVSPTACLCGGVYVGENAWICAGAVVLPKLFIGERAVVGAGAVVTGPVERGAVVAGNPARPLPARHGGSGEGRETC